MKDLLKRSKIFSAMFCGWSILSAIFGMLIILNKGHFEETGTKEIFIFSTSLYVIIAALLGILEYGFIKIFSIRKKKTYFQIIQKLLGEIITEEQTVSNIPISELVDAFNSALNLPQKALKDGIKYIVLVIFSVLLTEWIISGVIINLPVILLGGLISVFLFLLFGKFFVELSISPGLMIIRKELIQRKEEIIEPPYLFSSLKTKIHLFFSASILVVMTILSFITPPNFNIIIFAFIGLLMSLIISWLLYSQIKETFFAIETFNRELIKKERAIFTTGSLDVEIVDLYNSLNKTANEVYTARQELEERIKELEKFHKLTVGRELRMVELKEEIERLKAELKRYKN